ncbi:MAG: dephospho-CoA kinase [Bacteroidota bacterium]
MIVGLTGGIGSGKSTVAHLFRKHGVPVYDSDVEAKKIMEGSEEVRQAIINQFGNKAYSGQKLNKTVIADEVFGNRDRLKTLNAIVHPAVREHFWKWVEQQEFPYVIQETALIFENKMQGNFDRIVLVTAPEETRIQRVIERDKVSKQQVRARMANQLPDTEKIKEADIVIQNLDLNTTEAKVTEIHHQFMEQGQQN